MTAPPCAVCEKRPTPDGYACSGCANRAAGQLAAIIELAPDARLVAAGLVRRGRGGSGGKPASRPPLNDGATDVVDAVTNALTTLVRDIAETRGLQSVSKPPEPRLVPDPLIVAARALTGQLEWLRHAVDDQAQPYAVAAFHEIGHCAGWLRAVVDGSREKRYLGPCGAVAYAVEPMSDGYPSVVGQVCDGDVKALVGARTGKCRTCKTEYDVEARQDWIVTVVRDWPFTAHWIARELGIVHVKTIRTWANRGQLATYWRTAGGLVTPWTDTDDEAEVKARGDRLHYVGDVEALHAAAESERARRAAGRAAESEDAA